MRNDLEKVQDALYHLEESAIDTPNHLRGTLITDYHLIDTALQIAVKAVKERDELRERAEHNARESSKSTAFLVKSMMEGKITINR